MLERFSIGLLEYALSNLLIAVDKPMKYFSQNLHPALQVKKRYVNNFGALQEGCRRQTIFHSFSRGILFSQNVLKVVLILKIHRINRDLAMVFCYRVDCCCFAILVLLISTLVSSLDPLCMNSVCNGIDFELESENGDTCVQCDECFTKNSRRICHSSGNLCVCLNNVPDNCDLVVTKAGSESGVETDSKMCYDKVPMKFFPDLQFDGGNETSIWFWLPNLAGDPYWKTVERKLYKITVEYEVTNREFCTGTILVSSPDNSLHQCSTEIFHMDAKNIEKSDTKEIRISVSRSKLPKLEHLIDFVTFRLSVEAVLPRQMHNVTGIGPMNEVLKPMESLSLTKERLHAVNPTVKGSGNVVLAVVLTVILLFALAIAAVIFLRRKGIYPFDRNGSKGFLGYRYAPENEVTTPVTKSPPITSAHPLLDESMPEIHDFRDLLSICPMVLPPKLDIQETIGSGKFGLIHKGILKDTKVEAMVHSATSPFRLNPREMKQFLKIFEPTARAAQHPNIVSLLGVCDQDERLLICLEMISGPNLQTLLRESRTKDHFSEFAVVHQTATLMSSQRLLNLMLGVARGVAHLEDHQVLHSHLAAVNVLIGEGGTPKIAGFGFATLRDLYMRDNDKKHSPLRWCAPESMPDSQGYAEISLRSQIWSFGILLWEIVTLGGTPYPRTHTEEVRKRVKAGEMRPEKPQYASTKLYEFLCKCWTFDPTERLLAMEALGQLQDLALHANDHINLKIVDGEFSYEPIVKALEEN